MKKKYIIRNEDCRKTIEHMKSRGIEVDCVLTSPPYNISRRVGCKKRQLENREKLYKYYDDTLSWNEYKDFLQSVLYGCLLVLKKRWCNTFKHELCNKCRNRSNSNKNVKCCFKYV